MKIGKKKINRKKGTDRIKMTLGKSKSPSPRMIELYSYSILEF